MPERPVRLDDWTVQYAKLAMGAKPPRSNATHSSRSRLPYFGRIRRGASAAGPCFSANLACASCTPYPPSRLAWRTPHMMALDFLTVAASHPVGSKLNRATKKH